MKKCSGESHKTSGSLQVISWYSHSTVRAQNRNSERCIAPLTYHNLSLHNTAHVRWNGNGNLQNQYNKFSETHLATAGPPMAMRENRTPFDNGNSGNELRTSTYKRPRSPKPKNRDTVDIASNLALQKKSSQRKCRSAISLLNRKVRRANERRRRRQQYRNIKHQATDLANQSRLFAQDPSEPSENMIYMTQHETCEHRSHPCTTAPPSNRTHSDYQDVVLNKQYVQQLKIASLNCRGLSSLSKRERVIHLMEKHGLDILCLQETKINSNSREELDSYTMYWSTGVSDEARNKAETLKRSGKARRQHPEDMRTFRAAIEHLGVGICCSRSVARFTTDIKQISARNIVLTLRMQAGDLDVVSTYAPQACAAEDRASEKHYDELNNILDSKYKFSPKIVVGDFNARLIKAMPHETSVIGPHTLGKLSNEISELSDAQFQNRLRFTEFCLSHDMVAKNTYFEKSDEQLVTYKAVGVKEWKPPWHLHKFAQMDYFLISSKWKNAITNIVTTVVHTVESDHKLMIANVCFKLKANAKSHFARPCRYHVPSQQQLTNYNDLIRQHAEDDNPHEQHNTNVFDRLNNIMLTSANETLTKKHPKIKKPYISQETWNLLEKKWTAIERGDQEIADELSKEIKKQVQQDRENDLLQQLEEITAQGYKWEGLKKLRAKFSPSFTKFKDIDGNHVPFQDYANKAAEYLEKIQWKAPDLDDQESRENIPLQNGSYIIDDSPFTITELEYVLNKIKNNKSPGADQIPGELFKWLDVPNRRLVLDAANVCLEKGEMDHHLMQAIVVSIYKKGDACKLENYRPISLLNACYKIVAALVKVRLDKGLDSWLMATQFGFRKHKSTAHAIFMARRLQDISEKSRTASTLILLDWEKAFDKVSQQRMLEVLRRLQVPDKLYRLIKDFYANPEFKVSSGKNESEWKPQYSGIRQGCPLSPFLFVLVMGALFADIKMELCTPRQLQPLDGIYFSEILFADDTLIFGANTQCINKLLHAIERHSAYYGLKLNYGKCVNLTANQRVSSVRFSSDGPAAGRLVPRQRSATYLGTLLTDTFDNKAEIANRLGDCIATCNRLKIFWKKANTSIKWKIQVFNAIVRSKLLYGLECIQLTNAEISKLNAFQNKSLRRILGKPPTFIDREQTNQRMYQEIRQVYHCNFEHFGDTWRKAKLRLFGHVLRSSRSDPLNQVVFHSDNLRPRTVLTRRVGRPKSDWLLETYADAYKQIAGPIAVFDPDNDAHLRVVKQQALQRLDPF